MNDASQQGTGNIKASAPASLSLEPETELRFTNWLTGLMVLADDYRKASPLTAQTRRDRLRAHAERAFQLG